MLGSVQICGEKISHKETRDLCESLEDNAIRLLSLRGCKMKGPDYLALINSFGNCKSILQLNLNLKVVKDLCRAVALSEALMKNRSLTSLFLHGCPLGFSGVAVLVKGLSLHPNVVSLDLGDCQLTDSALLSVADLLPPNGAKRGLQDLTLSGNPGITPHGWSKFFIAMSASHTLRNLHIDYNNIMDYGMSCLSVVLAASKTLHRVDVEGSGLTELGAQTILYLVRNYPVTVRTIVLGENNISDKTRAMIEVALNDNPSLKSSESSQTTEYNGESTVSSDSSDTESQTESSQSTIRLHPNVRIINKGVSQHVTSVTDATGKEQRSNPKEKTKTNTHGQHLTRLTQSVLSHPVYNPSRSAQSRLGMSKQNVYGEKKVVELKSAFEDEDEEDEEVVEAEEEEEIEEEVEEEKDEKAKDDNRGQCCAEAKRPSIFSTPAYFESRS